MLRGGTQCGAVDERNARDVPPRRQPRIMKMRAARDAPATPHITAAALVPVAVLTLVWGCNWPVLKMGVTELEPLTFRALTLPFAALGMLAVARLSGDSIRIPRALWPKVATLALFNITGWNGLVLFGVAQLPAGRSAILAYTMPVWSVLFSLVLLSEPLSARKVAGWGSACSGWACCWATTSGISSGRRSPRC